MRILRIFLLAALSASLAACATYEQPDKKDPNVSVIRSERGPESAKVISVDGKSLVGFPQDIILKKVGAYLAPGKHIIGVQRTESFSEPLTKRNPYGIQSYVNYLWLVAEPGQQYSLKSAERLGRDVAVWIEDSSGRKVGGYVGDNNEPAATRPAAATASAASAASAVPTASTAPAKAAGQAPIPLDPNFLQSPGARIGIVMARLPKPDSKFVPTAVCDLACIAVLHMNNSWLTRAAEKLPSEPVLKIRVAIASQLHQMGQDVTAFDQGLEIETLPKLSAGSGLAPFDFRSLADLYGIEKLIVLDVKELGLRLASSQPGAEANAPQGLIRVTAYMVNLADNRLEWYLPVRALSAAEKPWQQEPYTQLGDAYLRAIDYARDELLKPLRP